MPARQIITIALACLLTGCESMSPYEQAWQTMHLVDVAQTLNGPASDACYRETEWPTRALIGEYPDRDEVIVWGIGAAVAHYLVGRWIEDSDWPDGVKLTLRSIDLSYKGATIWRNHDQGIRPFGDNVSCMPEPIYYPDAQPIK